MRIAAVLLIAATIYFVLGVLFAAAFIARGVTRIDAAANRSRWTFRAIVLPGAALLWPLMLSRWLGAVRRERAAGAAS